MLINICTSRGYLNPKATLVYPAIVALNNCGNVNMGNYKRLIKFNSKLKMCSQAKLTQEK
jgi:hypothetical protein